MSLRSGFDFFMRPLTGVFVWFETRLDQGGWVRRAALALAFYMVWRSTLWAAGYAEAHADRPGLETAAVIAAVTAGPSGVAAFVFKWYTEARTTAAGLIGSGPTS